MISISNPEPSLRGWLRRYLIEVPGMTFCGRPGARLIAEIQSRVRGTRGSAVIITAAGNEIGMHIEIVNSSRWRISDFDGLELVSYVGSLTEAEKLLSV